LTITGATSGSGVLFGSGRKSIAAKIVYEIRKNTKNIPKKAYFCIQIRSVIIFAEEKSKFIMGVHYHTFVKKSNNGVPSPPSIQPYVKNLLVLDKHFNL
jgi:hypothetical protein